MIMYRQFISAKYLSAMWYQWNVINAALDLQVVHVMDDHQRQGMLNIKMI